MTITVKHAVTERAMERTMLGISLGDHFRNEERRMRTRVDDVATDVKARPQIIKIKNEKRLVQQVLPSSFKSRSKIGMKINLRDEGGPATDALEPLHETVDLILIVILCFFI